MAFFSKKSKGQTDIIFETARLIIREYAISDSEDMYRNWSSDSRVTEFMSWDPHKSIKDTKQFINNNIDKRSDGCSYDWVIVLKALGQAIGGLTFRPQKDSTEYGDFPSNTFNVGYVLSADYWGQGIIAEATRAGMQYMFDNGLADRVVARHHIDNPNSGKVMQKVGMTYLYDRDDEDARKYLKRESCTMQVYVMEKASL